MIIFDLMVIGSFVLIMISWFCVIYSVSHDYSLVPFIIMIIIGLFIGIMGTGLSADSAKKSQTQIQEPQSETAIIRAYDKNENLINEWRVKK